MSCRIVEVVVRGRRLPGRAAREWTNLHIGLQVGSRAEGLVPADVPAAEWRTELEVIPAQDRPDGEPDYRGHAVNGKRGERFLYLTWGEVHGGQFSMVRRAKLMLADIVREPVASRYVVDVDLTDERGGPRAARVHDLAVQAAS